MELAQKAAVVAALVAVACSSPGAAAPPPVKGAWTMYRGDLARDGHAAGSLTAHAAPRLSLAWRTRLDGAVDGTPAVSDGMVFAASAGGTVAALDAATGRTVWSKRGLGAISSSPAVVGGRLLVGTLTGSVRMLQVSDGRELWRWQGPPDGAIWSSPTVYGSTVIVGVASPYGDTPLVPGRLVGLDLATGAERWDQCLLAGCRPGDGVWSTPAIDGSGNAFIGVGNPDDGVLAFDPETGKRRWLASLYPDAGRDLDVGASPVVFTLAGRELVAQATVQGSFAVLDAATGAIAWTRDVVQGSAVHGLLASPAYDGTGIYAASASPPTGIFALSPADGSVLWRRETDLPVYSAPAAGDGVIVFGTGNVFGDANHGSLLAVSTADGSVLWSYDAHSAVRSGPATTADFVVAGDAAGEVVAFRVRSG